MNTTRNKNTIQVKPFKTEKTTSQFKITWNSCISDLDYAAYIKKYIQQVHQLWNKIITQR